MLSARGTLDVLLSIAEHQEVAVPFSGAQNHGFPPMPTKFCTADKGIFDIISTFFPQFPILSVLFSFVKM